MKRGIALSELISILKRTQTECIEYGKWLQENAPKLEKSFNYLHNHAMSAQELLEGIGSLQVQTKKQGDERIMLVMRANWVFMLSVIEYYIQKILRESDKPMGLW